MQTKTTLWLTEQDLNRLRHLIIDLTRTARGAQAGIEALEEILDLGRIVPAEEIPHDVVTMNSEVVFDEVDSGEQRTVTLTYPDQAVPADGKVSVLSPVGIALLGLAVGAETALSLPRGRMARIRIRGIRYQPEASGEYSS